MWLLALAWKPWGPSHLWSHERGGRQKVGEKGEGAGCGERGELEAWGMAGGGPRLQGLGFGVQSGMAGAGGGPRV